MGNSGFLQSLFDLSFTEFVTTKIIKLLFVLGVAVCGLGAVMVFFSGLAMKSFFGVLVAFIGAPLAFLVYVLLLRIWLELVIVIFRIAENTTQIAAQGRQNSASPPSA